jgi:hypothetical protein
LCQSARHRSSNVFAQTAAARVDPNETKAQDLGYRDDAGQVDKAKFAKYESGQVCATCRFYKGLATEPLGPCQVFSGRQVSSKGWCISYWKKAEAAA